MHPANEKDKRPTVCDIPYAALSTTEQIALQLTARELPAMFEDLTCKHAGFEINCVQCTRFLTAGMAHLATHEQKTANVAARSAIDLVAAQQSERELHDMLEGLTCDHSTAGTAYNHDVQLPTARIASVERDPQTAPAAALLAMQSETIRAEGAFGSRDVDFSMRILPHGEHKCSGCTTHKLFQRVLNDL